MTSSEPMPWVQVVVVTLVTVVDGACTTIIYPFVAAMVVSFKDLDVDSTDDSGLWAGLLGSAYGVAQIIFSPLWGYVSDRKGCKYVLVRGLIFSTVSLIIFGISETFVMAVIARFFHGMFSCLIGVTRTYISDVVPECHQSKAQSVLGCAWGIGGLIGPFLGGILVDPVKQYDFQHFRDVLNKHPYLPPSLAAAAINVITLLMVMKYVYGNKRLMRIRDSATDPLLKSPEGDKTAKTNNKSIMTLLQNPMLVLVSLGYLLSMTVYVVNVEVMALWGAANKDKGGLGFSSSQLGLLLTTTGLAYLVSQFGVPYVVKVLGAVGGYRLCTLLFIPIELAEGWAAEVLDWSVYFGWVFIIFTEVAKYITFGPLFTCIALLINNTTDRANTGLANGIAFSLACVGKAVGPFIGGWLFATTLNAGPEWPINWYSSFIALAIISGTSTLVGFFLKPCLNEPYPEDEIFCIDNNVPGP